ncbi:MAG TPA: LysE family translocator [Pirellulales bacterium]|jgi:threonine/homoserine/homoserine lactone efflux protein|nr:LysE family translocator [Pirellulales bacterium]
MLGTQNFGLFLVSAILLNLTPGQDTFYILGRSIAQGRRAGLVSVLGIISGCLVHTIAASLGLSAILATSGTAFLMVKFVGAAYLVYLGARILFQNPNSTTLTPEFGKTRSWAIYRAGLLTNLLNPKVALFFMSFLPQFVDPSAASKIGTFLFLGAVFICTGTIWCLVLAWSASAIGRRLRDCGSFAIWIRRVTGAVFVALGVKLAVSK